jgi:hypothetical protein
MNEDEQKYMEQTEREMDCISNMITQADKQHLSVEVILSYGEFRAAGDSIEVACFGALNEWDC